MGIEPASVHSNPSVRHCAREVVKEIDAKSFFLKSSTAIKSRLKKRNKQPPT